MYDSVLTRQSLPSERYRVLLGTAISVFGSNNGFIIENVLRINDSASWYALIDKTSGAVKNYVEGKLPDAIVQLFGELVDMRNRIIHGFRITNISGEQIIATKEKSGRQFEITEDYLLDFIRKNEEFSNMLYIYRVRLISDVVPGQIDVRDIEIPDFELVEEASDEAAETENDVEVE